MERVKTMKRNNHDFQRGLRHFDAVWERLGRPSLPFPPPPPPRPPHKPGTPWGPGAWTPPPPPPPPPGPPPLMPGRKRPCRRCPPHRR